MNRSPDRALSEIQLSIAIGIQGSGTDFAAYLDALPPEPGVEILLCHTTNDPQLSSFVELAETRTDIRLVPCEPDALIPEMWRNGFWEAKGTWVATLNNHCPPNSDWLPRAMLLISADAEEYHAAFGGAIIADPDTDNVGRGIHLLRYANGDLAGAREQVEDISADNAIYRREAVLANSDLLSEGFWEPNFHRRFLSAGLVMENVPDLIVVHKNCYSAAEFRLQRLRHGRVFGRHRSEGCPRWMQWTMFLASPAAFPVFAVKQTRKVLSRPSLRSDLSRAALPFYSFLASWCIGEAFGYADALRARSGSRS